MLENSYPNFHLLLNCRYKIILINSILVNNNSRTSKQLHDIKQLQSKKIICIFITMIKMNTKITPFLHIIQNLINALFYDP